MRKLGLMVAGMVLACGMGFAAPAESTFVGSISDSMCGAKHMMAGESDKQCTIECVKGGSKYILVGPQDKIYQLSDQKTPEQFAGAKVKVTGTLKGDTIKVTSIVAGN